MFKDIWLLLTVSFNKKILQLYFLNSPCILRTWALYFLNSRHEFSEIWQNSFIIEFFLGQKLRYWKSTRSICCIYLHFRFCWYLRNWGCTLRWLTQGCYVKSWSWCRRFQKCCRAGGGVFGYNRLWLLEGGQNTGLILAWINVCTERDVSHFMTQLYQDRDNSVCECWGKIGKNSFSIICCWIMANKRISGNALYKAYWNSYHNISCTIRTMLVCIHTVQWAYWLAPRLFWRLS